MTGDTRVDGASYENFRDDSHRANATHRAGAQNVDRQQQHLQSMTEGAAGGEQYAAVRNRTRHQMDEVSNSNQRSTDRTVDGAKEFINNVNQAANKSII